MSDALAQLEPRPVWEYFASILSIPRPSKQEQRIIGWIRSWAEERGFGLRSDRAGNLVVDVPASEGREQARGVILQAHLDMVCEKDRNTPHDFERDPIQPRIQGDWVYGSGTTLGADNGIGVAAALAAASDPGVVHGPLQLLFTVDEECGLSGAAGLDGSLLAGRVLLNLDSEEDGVLCVGCSGGADTRLTLRPKFCAPTPGGRAYRLELTGLRGGHSGINIHENRGNALKLLTRILAAVLDSGVALELYGLYGGSKSNAIPREAEARFFLADGGPDRFKSVLGRMVKDFRSELRGTDERLEVKLNPTQHEGTTLDSADRNRLLHLLMALPSGVLGMSPTMPNLVETSANLAIVERQEDEIGITISSRSNSSSRLDAALASVRATATLAGARVNTRDRYPGWAPNSQSAVLGVARGVYTEVWGQEPEVTAVHAGLECGLIGQKQSGLDMISFGPQIEGAHSPEERVLIPSVGRFWRALRGILAELAG